MRRAFLAVSVAAGVLTAPLSATAVAVPWVGTADYRQAPGAAGDEDLVGPFDGYDFANGVALLKPKQVQSPGSLTPGDTFAGYYQSYVSLHQLNGIEAAAPNLVKTGLSGPGATGYELTITAEFEVTVDSVGAFGDVVFSAGNGQAALWFDATPDYSFPGDSGFDNGAAILTGAVVGGRGSFLPFIGAGFSTMELSVSPMGYDQNVFDPDTIGGGTGIFTLRINASGTGPTAGVGSVLGHAYVTGVDILEEADGNLRLTVVPLPAAVWLLAVGLLGYLGIGRRGRLEATMASA